MSLMPRLTCAALCLAATTALAQDAVTIRDDMIGSLVYGVYCAEAPTETTPAPDTAAGIVNLVPTLPEIRAVTTLVPAEIGMGFGLLVEAQTGLALDPVDITITHPPYPDSGIEVERWRTSIGDFGPGLVGFSFENPSELVVGEWTFEGVYDGKTIFRVAFEVLPPAALPDLAGNCSANFMS